MTVSWRHLLNQLVASKKAFIFFVLKANETVQSDKTHCSLLVFSMQKKSFIHFDLWDTSRLQLFGFLSYTKFYVMVPRGAHILLSIIPDSVSLDIGAGCNSLSTIRT